ncbi:MAG: hypothetical protein R3C68_13270 [Myxococcota bacterium]
MLNNRGRQRLNTTTSGMLLAGASVPLGVVHGGSGALLAAPPELQAGGAAVAALLLIAALSIMHYNLFGRIAATLGILGTLIIGLPYLVTAPLATLSVLLASTTALVLLWKIGGPLIAFGRFRRRPLYEGQTQGAAIVALAMWIFWVVADTDRFVDTLVVGWAVACSSLLTLEFALRQSTSHPHRAPSSCWPSLVRLYWRRYLERVVVADERLCRPGGLCKPSYPAPHTHRWNIQAGGNPFLGTRRGCSLERSPPCASWVRPSRSSAKFCVGH